MFSLLYFNIVKIIPIIEVVEDAKQNFASTSTAQDLPLPPLPLPLACNVSQNRSSRLPRRVLAASQIFQADENGNVSPMDETMLSTANSTYLSANDNSRSTILPPADTFSDPKTPSSPSQKKKSQLQIPEIHTPSRQRRATVSTRSPEPSDQVSGIEGSPSKRKERSRSYGNLFQRRIAPISLLEAELNKSLFFCFSSLRFHILRWWYLFQLPHPSLLLDYRKCWIEICLSPLCCPREMTCWIPRATALNRSKKLR